MNYRFVTQQINQLRINQVPAYHTMLRRTIPFFLFISMAVFPSSAQTTVKLEDFDAISVIGNIDVELIKGEEPQATVYTYGIPEEKLSMFVTRGTLKLQLLNSIFYDNEKVKVVLTYQQLRGIRMQAGSRMSSDSTITGDKIEVRIASGAQAHLELGVNVLEASASEGGILELRGTTDRQDVRVATGGRYDGYYLDSNKTYVRAHTGGTATVVANETLDASANTGGSIEYRGEPDERNTRTLFSGGVRKI